MIYERVYFPSVTVIHQSPIRQRYRVVHHTVTNDVEVGTQVRMGNQREIDKAASMDNAVAIQEGTQ